MFLTRFALQSCQSGPLLRVCKKKRPSNLSLSGRITILAFCCVVSRGRATQVYLFISRPRDETELILQLYCANFAAPESRPKKGQPQSDCPPFPPRNSLRSAHCSLRRSESKVLHVTSSDFQWPIVAPQKTSPIDGPHQHPPY